MIGGTLYYKQLERLESEESQQLLACLMEQAVPINSEQRLQCSQNLKRAPKYNFNEEDLMDRIPTNCFQGIQRRLEKQCGALRDCCSSVENCANFENSEITTKIKKLKDFIKDYGKQCQLGLTTDDLFFNEDGDLEEKKPNGNIIVRFNTEEKPKQYSPKIDTNNQQRLLVRVFTAAEEIERLRESGDDVEADKLQKELENVEGMFKGTSAKMISTSELEGSVPSLGTTASATTETGDEFWSTQAPKMITGLEIASETSTSSTTISTEEPSTSTKTITSESTASSTITSTSEPLTTTTFTSTTSTTTTTPSTTTSTTTTTPLPTTTTTQIHLITDTPQPEASEAESEALIPNQSPPTKQHSTPTNDPPKTVTAKPPHPLDDILKKYSHVKTLNKLVEHFKDQNSETFTKNEQQNQTTPPFIDSDKLQ
uniref:Uncharacterized protein n=1 Tax=Panagrolaimus davidi TaxID=227884 RepID=A0A914QTM6_9BILA